MNYMKELNDLPPEALLPLLDCFVKWKEITEIGSLEVFFNDVLLSAKMSNYRKHEIINDTDGFCLRLIDDKDKVLSLYNYSKESYYGYMSDFITETDKVHEDYKRSTTS